MFYLFLEDFVVKIDPFALMPLMIPSFEVAGLFKVQVVQFWFPRLGGVHFSAASLDAMRRTTRSLFKFPHLEVDVPLGLVLSMHIKDAGHAIITTRLQMLGMMGLSQIAAASRRIAF